MLSKEEVLKSLSEGTLVEDESIEFKRDIIAANYGKIAQYFVGLANSGGGYFIVGVRETAHGCEVEGLSLYKIHQIKLFIESAIKNTPH